MAKGSGSDRSGRAGGKIGSAGRESGYSGNVTSGTIRGRKYTQYSVTEPSGETNLYDERGRNYATIPAKLTTTSYAIGKKRD